MKDHDPIRTARRKARQEERERLGIAIPPCMLCIEDHHTAGRNHDFYLTAPLCQKHHRQIHEHIRIAGISLQHQPNELMRIAQALRAAAIYDRARAEAMERWATLLEHSLGKL